ncbi:MAG: UDP-glucose dehydrogenase family protein [Candidatus Bipolaricaulia bacterium]
MRITVVGTGYVGLVVGTCLSDSGHDVICVDNDEAKIRQLNDGDVPIYEPGLKELIDRNVRENRLRFTTDLTEGVQHALLIFIAVGTPIGADGSVDLSRVFEVADGIGKAMNGYKIVVDKSTVPVGTAERIREIIIQHTDQEFDVASNPEFLKEGMAVQDFMKPDRVIIGTDDVRVAELMKELYASFVRTENPIIVMDIRSAEMTKYAANAMLATKISFMNEMANLCERLGADVEQVRKGLGADKRIGYSFLFPGVGYGGSCLGKDIKTLIDTGKQQDYEPQILAAVDRTNEAQKLNLFQKIHDHFGGDLRGKRIAVWGLSFKPGTNDMRDAPSITIIERLLDHGAEVRAHDPKAQDVAKRIFADRIVCFDDYYRCVEGAEALVLITEWNEFRNPDFGRIKAKMNASVVFDGRNIYSPSRLRELGFTYYGIGRP